MTKNYRLKIVRADFQLEVEGDKAFVLKMLERFEGAKSENVPRTQPAGVKKDARTVSAIGKPFSLGEFVRQGELKKHTDLVLAFGYYLEKHSGLKAFTPADINNCYYEAKMESSNTSQMLIQNIKRGYIMEAKSTKDIKAKKAYVLTATGETYIEKKMAKKG